MENICFICGNDKETLEKASDIKQGFLNHIKVSKKIPHFFIKFISCLKRLIIIYGITYFILLIFERKKKLSILELKVMLQINFQRKKSNGSLRLGKFSFFCKLMELNLRALCLKDTSSVLEKERMIENLNKIKTEVNTFCFFK